MYTPKHFKMHDMDVIKAFVHERSFATLVTHQEGQLRVSHLPLTLSEDEDRRIWLHGHLAKANHHGRGLDQPTECTVIFTGPDHYISPQWYDHTNVPTWNYLAVHARGSVQTFTERDELVATLTRQVAKHEAEVGEKFTLEALPDAYRTSEITGIVGIRILVAEWEGNFKMSQNRDRKNHTAIIDRLRGLNTCRAHLVADAMIRHSPHGEDGGADQST